MESTSGKIKVPKFATEAAEARWWDRRAKTIEKDLVTALRTGTAQRGTARRLVQEARESKNITIRMPVAEIERARTLAEKKGIGYQTYMKMLLREALDRETRKAG
jgi:predicted DNA binding CopG/RHH family protein